MKFNTRTIGTLVIIVLTTFYAQGQWNSLVATDHVSLEAYQSITNGGCDYGARLVNHTDQYILVPKSKVKAKFRYERWSNSAEKWKRYSSTKTVRIPKVMLRPNRQVTRERDRSDSDNKKYIRSLGLQGEFEGTTIVGHGNQVNEEGAVELSHDGSKSVIYENSSIIIRAYLGTGILGNSLGGYSTYPTHIEVESKQGDLKFSQRELKYRLFYQGIYRDYSEKIRKVKSGNTNHNKQNFDGTGYAFEPRVFIKVVLPPQA